MFGESLVQIGLFWQRELEHHRSLTEVVEVTVEGIGKQEFGFGLVRRIDRHFGFDDRHQTVVEDRSADLELLGDDRLDAGCVRLVDDRAHLGAIDAGGVGTVEQIEESWVRGQQLHAVVALCESGVALDERHDAHAFPQVLSGRHAVDESVHRLLEQDGADDAAAGERLARDETSAHRMDEVEHFVGVGPRRLVDAIGG